MKETILLASNYIIKGLTIIVFTYIVQLIRRYNLEKWTKIGVNAVEQIYNESGMGSIKKAVVIEFVKNKFRVNDNDLEMLIESIVAGINLAKKK